MNLQVYFRYRKNLSQAYLFLNLFILEHISFSSKFFPYQVFSQDYRIHCSNWQEYFNLTISHRNIIIDNNSDLRYYLDLLATLPTCIQNCLISEECILFHKVILQVNFLQNHLLFQLYNTYHLNLHFNLPNLKLFKLQISLK